MPNESISIFSSEFVQTDTGSGELTEEQRAFLDAIRRHQLHTGREILTWKEILIIAKGVGYRKEGHVHEEGL